jgi:structural maintenance of chromosome 3 (chondroitin sulfate proteoglycan 6)
LPSLSAADQREVDKLNDDIRQLTATNKNAFTQRMKLEAEKNKLENLLSNNLNRRKDELVLVSIDGVVLRCVRITR